MHLFDEDIGRVVRYAKYSESHYRFMNISAKPKYIAIRNKLEEWFTHYPVQRQAEFIVRFKSEEDEQFLSAFFELLLHEFLLKLNYNIVVHPDLKNSNKHPDFLLTNSNGEEFYFEAAISTDISVEEIGRKKVLNIIFDIINEINTSNFFIHIEINKLPDKPIPASHLRKFLQNELDKLNPDHLGNIINKFGWDSVPKWNFNYDGFEIEFEPIPRGKEFRSESIDKPIGITLYPFKFFEPKKSITTTLNTKAKKYKDLEKPYIIAVNALDSSIRQIDILEVLFGSMTYKLGVEKSVYSSDKLSDGFWHTTKEPKYTRVSAVIITQQLYPWSIGMQEFKLYINPWAKFSYSGDLNTLSNFTVNNNRVVETEGISINQILGIPQGWPHNLS